MVRLRFAELLEQKGLTPYGLARLSGGRIPLTTAYRLKQRGGAVRLLDTRLLDLLCELLEVGPEELLVREPDRKPAAKTSRAAKAPKATRAKKSRDA